MSGVLRKPKTSSWMSITTPRLPDISDGHSRTICRTRMRHHYLLSTRCQQWTLMDNKRPDNNKWTSFCSQTPLLTLGGMRKKNCLRNTYSLSTKRTKEAYTMNTQSKRPWNSDNVLHMYMIWNCTIIMYIFTDIFIELEFPSWINCT